MLENISEKEILPVGDEDMILPTRIARQEAHIRFLNDQLAELTHQIRDAEFDRSAMITRAKEVRVFEDTDYKIIEVPVYPKKSVDVDALKRISPEKHAIIVANLTEKAKDKLKAQLEKVQVFISQADVKAVISDKVLLAQIIPEQTVPSGFETSIVKK